MSISILQTLTAVGPGITASFGGTGGVAPYTYAVNPGGAGGTIGSSTGIYTAPANVPTTPKQQSDVIVVTDSVGATATAKILVGDALLLFCDILQNQLGLAPGRVYLWDQKIMQPTDNGLYIAVSVLNPKVFANTKSYDGSGSGLNSKQSCNIAATLQIDIISRDTSALRLKEQVIMALNSDYAEMQMNANSFFIGKIPPGAQFNNLSMQDGAAIPYRFVISTVIQYFSTLTTATGYMSPTTPTVNYVQS